MNIWSVPMTADSHPLTSRQEAFCRHYCATGNAAESARRAGYAEGAARQTGHDLLTRPWIVARIRAIREHWRRTTQAEAAILLARLEDAWDAAVAAGSVSQMLQVIRLQAEIAGLSKHSAPRRAETWDTPGEEAPTQPPLTSDVRQARHRHERALAGQRRQPQAEPHPAPAGEDTGQDLKHLLHTAIAARRTLERQAARCLLPVESLTHHDKSLPPADAGDGLAADAAEAAVMAEALDPTASTRF